MAVEADAAEFAGYAVHEDVGATDGPEGGEEHAVEVGLAEVAVLAGDGLAVGGCGSNGGEGGAAFGQTASSRAKLEGEGFDKPKAGAVGEALKLIHPVGGDRLDGGLLLEGPLKGLRGGETAVGGGLHGLGELQTNEVAEALAVLKAKVVRGSREFREGKVDGNDSRGLRSRQDTRLTKSRLQERTGLLQFVMGLHGCRVRERPARAWETG